MTDPLISPPIFAVTAGGLTVVGVVTGLDPVLMFAGACGGWWAHSYMDPQPVAARVNNVLLSSIIAAWTSGSAAGYLVGTDTVPDGLEGPMGYAAAIIIGFLTVPVLGAAIMDIGRAAKRAVLRVINSMGPRP